MGVPKDPEKRRLWIENRTGKNNSRFGTKNPVLSEWCRQHSGEKSPSFGKKRPDLTERNRRNTGEKNHMFGNHHTEESKEKMRGENHWNWKDGITPLTKQIRHLLEYKNWIENIFKRDNFTCQDCNKRGGYLHAHHKKLFSIILEENNITTLGQAEQCSDLWNINNGVTLCIKCHKKYHNKKGE